jgi:hypothetical protein
MTARTMSSETCQNFCGAAEAGGVDRRKGQARIVDEDVHPAEPLQRNRDNPVAFRRAAQIRGKRQDAPCEVGAFGLDLRDIRVDMPYRDDMMSFARETEGHRPPQSAQPARNDRNPLFHAHPPGFITMRQ